MVGRLVEFAGDAKGPFIDAGRRWREGARWPAGRRASRRPLMPFWSYRGVVERRRGRRGGHRTTGQLGQARAAWRASGTHRDARGRGAERARRAFRARRTRARVEQGREGAMRLWLGDERCGERCGGVGRVVRVGRGHDVSSTAALCQLVAVRGRAGSRGRKKKKGEGERKRKEEKEKGKEKKKRKRREGGKRRRGRRWDSRRRSRADRGVDEKRRA